MLSGLLHKAQTLRLQDALRTGNLERVRSALRHGASPDAPFAVDGDTPPQPPVLNALGRCQPDCLAALLQAGAKLPEHDPQDRPLLNLAISAPEHSLKLLTLLLQADLPADLSEALQQAGIERPLFCCLRLPDTQIMLHISRLLQYGADLNRPNRAGHTVLREALLAGHQPLVTALVSSGAALPADLDRLGCPDPLKALARRTHEDLAIRQQLHPF